MNFGQKNNRLDIWTIDIPDESSLVHLPRSFLDHINHSDYVDCIHLLCFIKNNDIEEVQKLLEKGVSTEFIDEDGYTPLMLAIKYGHTKIAGLLKQHGAKE
jgi:ankyrin repeat protein